MHYRPGKFKTNIRVSFGYDERGVAIRRYRSFDNPPKGDLTQKQYDKVIEKMAWKVHDELQKEYYQEQALKSLGLESGEYPTFSTLATNWLDDRLCKSIHTENTSADEKKKIERINKHLGNKRIDQIKAADVNNAIIAISREKSQGNGKKGQDLSGRTLAHYLATIKAVLNFGMEIEILSSNVASKVKAPKLRSTRKSPLTDDELTLILNAVAEKEDFMYQIAYNLLARTGMRRGTMCGLKFSDVSGDGTIVIRRAMIKNRVSKELQEKGTKAETINIVKIDTQLAKDILILKEVYDMRASELGTAYHKSDYIFVDIDGTQLQPNSLTQHTKRFRERYDLPYFSMHIFRHTYISTVAPIIGEDATAANTGHASKAGVQWYMSRNNNANDQARDIMMGKIPPKPIIER